MPAEFECGFAACSSSFREAMPHRLRAKAQGRTVYSVPLIIFMDDVSGNISKQWNKHHVIYMSNANLPREMLEKEFCIQFVSSSPHATPMELMEAMRTSICKAADSGIVAWDCVNHEEVLLDPYGLFFGGDNPMHAEECSHAGMNSNHFCRTCHVGGTKAYKSSDEGYQTLFSSGKLRTPQETMAEVCRQVQQSVLPGGANKIKNAVATTGTSDTASGAIVNCLLTLGKQLQKANSKQPEELNTDANSPQLPQKNSKSEICARLEKELETLLGGQAIEDRINPLLGMPGVNIHMDTPTEILHTVLLGVVKYFWDATRLDQLSGLNNPTLGAEYICKYKGGLIGKHFKSLAQVMPFLVYDLVPQIVLDGWTAIGSLIVLLWHTEIINTEDYLAELSRVIEDFLNITASCAPSILISKPKFHFLVHLPAYIRRFGPAVLFSTERYESFNHVFRLASIYSNRQAPSRDTCNAFAAQDIIKHVATGGFWFDAGRKKWACAGDVILRFMESHPAQASLLGHKVQPIKKPGSVRLAAPVLENGKRQDPAVAIGQTFHAAVSFLTKNGDNAQLSDHVLYREKDVERPSVGKVVEILVPVGVQTARHVLLKKLGFLGQLHPQLRLPCLELTDQMVVARSEDVLCVANVQHDCATACCPTTGTARVRQERAETTRMRPQVKHNPEPRYLLNTFSLHNYSTIAAAIPDHLKVRTAVISNVQAVRIRAAQQIRDRKQGGEAGGNVPLVLGTAAANSIPGAENMPTFSATTQGESATPDLPMYDVATPQAPPTASTSFTMP
ncbi:hypothetical protein A0H81_02596, partial [Grifola frondosa]